MITWNDISDNITYSNILVSEPKFEYKNIHEYLNYWFPSKFIKNKIVKINGVFSYHYISKYYDMKIHYHIIQNFPIYNTSLYDIKSIIKDYINTTFKIDIWDIEFWIPRCNAKGFDIKNNHIDYSNKEMFIDIENHLRFWIPPNSQKDKNIKITNKHYLESDKYVVSYIFNNMIVDIYYHDNKFIRFDYNSGTSNQVFHEIAGWCIRDNYSRDLDFDNSSRKIYDMKNYIHMKVFLDEILLLKVLESCCYI